MILPDEDILTLAAAILMAADAVRGDELPVHDYVGRAAELQQAARELCGERLALHRQGNLNLSGVEP